MNDEINELKKLHDEIIDEIDDEIENLKYLLDHVEIENINLYQIYLKINELINNKKIIENKIINLKLLE